MIPPLIHQIWIGPKPLPQNYDKWHRQMGFVNHKWAVVLWDDKQVMADGFDLRSLYGKFWSHASVSNMLRLMIIQRYGGVYLDMDMEPLQPLSSRLPMDNRPFCADQGDGRLCNAVFGAAPNDPWVDWQIREGNREVDPHDAAWGVYTMTAAPRDYFGVYVCKSDLFYPYHYDAPKELRKPTEDTLCEHKWDGSWTKQ